MSKTIKYYKVRNLTKEDLALPLEGTKE